MRLGLDGSDGTSSLALVATGQRPDGSTWLMGTVTVPSPFDESVRVELNPFTVAGPHLLLVEVNGRRFEGSVSVSVVSALQRKKGAPTRRYLGRGQPVH